MNKLVAVVAAICLLATPAAAADGAANDRPNPTAKEAIEDFHEALKLLVPGSPANPETIEVPELAITVTGRQFAWAYRYELGAAGDNKACEIEGPIKVPQRKRVQLHVTSTDIIHEFVVPSLGIKAEGVPGRLVVVHLDTSKTGTFSGGATLTSGKGFRAMTIKIEVVANDAYDLWERETLRAKGCG